MRRFCASARLGRLASSSFSALGASIAAPKAGAAALSASPLQVSARTITNKVFSSAAEAIKASGIQDGSTLLAGGFGICGIPMTCIEAINDSGVKGLTVVSNNCGLESWGLGILLGNKRISKIIASYVGENPEFERQYLEGELELVMTPQGTLAEKLRAGGAGIPAFYTPTAVGTIIQMGGFPVKYKGKTGHVELASTPKETRVFNGKAYVLEESITGDVSIVKAWRADKFGNLQFRGTAQAFNPDVATAGRYTIAEVDEIVEVGAIAPADVHLSGGYVQAVVLTGAEKKIERRTVIPRPGSPAAAASTQVSKKVKDPEAQAIRERIARRAALEVQKDMNVNLGIGMPTLIPKIIPTSMDVMFQSENGLLGMGDFPVEGEEDADLINAGKETVTTVPGASIFSSSQSFAMIRGRHLDLTILGGMEVSRKGDLANWIIPGKLVKGMGGAMDLVSCGSRVVVTMEHNNKKGDFKILEQCSLPLTGPGVVDIIITDIAVFEVDKLNNELVLIEKIDDVSVDDIKARTGCKFAVSPNLTTYRQFSASA